MQEGEGRPRNVRGRGEAPLFKRKRGGPVMQEEEGEAP